MSDKALLDESMAARAEFARKMGRLGADLATVNRLIQDVGMEQIALLDTVVAQITQSGADVRVSNRMPFNDYQELLDRLGDEYVGHLTRVGLSHGADVQPEQLQEGAEVLALLANLIHVVPRKLRPEIWPTLRTDIGQALPHYQNIKRAIIRTGIAEALDAEEYAILANLRRETIPDVDLTVLRMAGEADPELAIRAVIRAARSAPTAALKGRTVTQLLSEAEKQLQEFTKLPSPPPAPPTPRRWTGWGKIFSGMAIAGVNIAGGIALSVGGGPLAADATLSGVLASCAGGIGNLAEGVGAFRGE